MSRLPILKLGITLAICLISYSSYAEEEAQFDWKPYVSTSVAYDDNVFRLSDKTLAPLILGTSSVSDTINRTEIGTNLDWKISRQHLVLNGNLNQTRFNRFGFINNDGYSYKAGWNWQLMNHLSGELSVSQDQSMAGFTEIQSPILNMRTRKIKLATANWEFHPRWRVYVRGDQTDFGNSLSSYASSNRTESAYETGIKYLTPNFNTVALSLREIDSQYVNRDPVSLALFGNANQQRELAVDTSWNATGKMRLQTRVAKVEREYTDVAQRNFNQWTGRVGVDWQVFNEIAISTSVSRALYAVDDFRASFVQSDILSFSPTWAISSKLTLQGSANYEDRNYLGNPVFNFAGQPREDKITNSSLSLSYLPHRKVQLQLMWNNERRVSNFANVGYKDNTISSYVRIDF